MTHAWCSDPSRDAAVRAAEDGRDRPLPTLEEAIARAFGFDKASAQRACGEVKSWPEDVQKDCRFVLGNLLEQGVERLQALVDSWRYGKALLAARYPDMIPKSVSASSAVEQESKGDGMRTERVTLEVTHGAPYCPAEWSWTTILRLKAPQSVRVVEEAHFDDLAQVAMERDSAIRERDEAVAQAAEDAHAYAAESDAQAQAQQELQDRCDTEFVPAESAGRGAAERLHRETWLRLERDELIIQRDELISRVAELEAQAKLAPDANDDGASNHAAQAASGGGEPVAWMVEWTDHAELYGSKTQAERAAAGDVVPQPLYCSPPQPRGWLTGEETEAVETARDHFDDDDHGDSECVFIARMLKQILARSTPPKVRLPDPVGETKSHGPLLRKRDVIASLAAAGVEVAGA